MVGTVCSPSDYEFSKAINDVLQDMDWETFTLVYESPESLINVQEVLKKKMGRSLYERATVVMKELPENIEDYRLAFRHSALSPGVNRPSNL